MEQQEHMRYDSLLLLRKNNHAWRLLASDNAEFVIAFLDQAFITEQLRDITEPVLVEQLENFMEYHQIEKSRTAKEYLTIWADDDHYLLRRFHTHDHNGNLIVHYDLTPFAVKAIDFIVALRGQGYVSTESRLVTVFHLLEEIALKSSDDGAERIASLEAQKAQIDIEITRTQQGDLDTLSDIQIRDRFLQAMEMSRQIISDFREVEGNFRTLHREMREKISTWDGGKGSFLDEYFAQEQAIEQSEQGRSFDAFWEFLLSRDQRQSFYDMLNKILALESIQTLDESQIMLGVEREWLRGGERIQQTIALLSGQLRQYVSETYLAEEKRINELIRQVEGLGHELRSQPPKEPVWTLTAPINGVFLPMDRPLFTPPSKMEIQSVQLEEGVVEVFSPVLFQQRSIDRLQLLRHINGYFPRLEQVSLEKIVADHPPKQGIGELLTYLEIAHLNDISEDDGVFYGVWTDEAGALRRAKLPNLVFRKEVT